MSLETAVVTAAKAVDPAPELLELLRAMVARRASDLLIICGETPKLRIDGSLVDAGRPGRPPAETKALVYSLLNEEQRARFEADQELDFSFGIAGLSRFRANVYLQRGTTALVVREVPFHVPTLDELGLPAVVGQLTEKTRGLILVTGSAGSGKSTTLAAMIEKINRERAAHVMTVEDPIEFVHASGSSTVSQREVGSDTHSFADALKHVLRQSPDILLVGEMRDLETIAAALTVAETGHLTLATLHTNSAADSVNRIIDVFPAHQQSQVRAQLAIVLEAVITQTLVPRADGAGRVCACEIMICTPAVRTAIRENRVHQIGNIIDTGRSSGMQTMERALTELVDAGVVTREEAVKRITDSAAIQRLMGGGAPVAAQWPTPARSSAQMPVRAGAGA